MVDHPAVSVDPAGGGGALARVLALVVETCLVVWTLAVIETFSSSTAHQSISPVASPENCLFCDI